MGTLSSLFVNWPQQFPAGTSSRSLFILFKGGADLLRLGLTQMLKKLRPNCDCFRLNGKHTWAFPPFHDVALGWDLTRPYIAVYSLFRLYKLTVYSLAGPTPTL